MAYKGSGMLVDGGKDRKRLVRLGVLLVVLIGVMIALGDLATRLREKVEFDYVQHQTGLLQRNPAQVLAFVQEQIKDAPYEGSLRGPVATLWQRSGSELDRAHLLMEMLQHCNVEAQLARSGDHWWVDSPAVPPPAGIAKAEWSGKLIPSDASHRLEIEIRAAGALGADQEPLRFLWDFADINNDPVLLDWASGSIQVRRASSRKLAGSMLLPADCEQLEIIGRHLLPNDDVALQSMRTLKLNRLHMVLAQDDPENSGFAVGVLMVLLATPPEMEEVQTLQLSGRILPMHASIAYQNAVTYRRSEEQYRQAPLKDLAEPSESEVPYLYLASVPQRITWMADAFAIEVQPFD
ncbi:MAG: hypothetical protein GY747_03780 [Planctomycetes bacterium]|nr:hypothetical protein [Planctomycetota bacterium]MCP4861643.1 hypothetical protein [Planctomycetota bacterium]